MSMKRLDSWKAIAEYLDRSARTVQRWHTLYGMPVHQIGHSKGSVFAYSEELDSWLLRMNSPSERVEPEEREEAEPRRAKSIELTKSALQIWKARSEENLSLAITLYRRAVDMYPGNCEALAGLANCMIFGTVVDSLDYSIALQCAKSAVERALDIDFRQPEARCAQAWLEMLLTRDWKQAERVFGRVLKEKPGEEFALFGLAMLRISEGNPTEAIRLSSEGWRLNPLVSSHGGLLSFCLYMAGQYDVALSVLLQIRSMGEESKVRSSIEALVLLQLEPATSAIERIENMVRGFPKANIIHGALGYSYAISGQLLKAQQVLENLESERNRVGGNCSYAKAIVLVGLGRNDEAIVMLEEAFEKGSIWSLGYRTDPILKPLSDDKRFQSLLGRLSQPASSSNGIAFLSEIISSRTDQRFPTAI